MLVPFSSLDIGRLHGTFFLISRSLKIHFWQHLFLSKIKSHLPDPFFLENSCTLVHFSTKHAKLFWMKHATTTWAICYYWGTCWFNTFLRVLYLFWIMVRMSLLSQGGKYRIVGSHNCVLVQSSDLGMNFAKVWQYLVSGLQFTDLQDYGRKYCYSWKHINSAALNHQRVSLGASGRPIRIPPRVSMEIFLWTFKSWALEPVCLFPPFPSLALYWTRSTCHGGSRVIHYCCQVQITSPGNVNLICCSCWQL